MITITRAKGKRRDFIDKINEIYNLATENIEDLELKVEIFTKLLRHYGLVDVVIDKKVSDCYKRYNNKVRFRLDRQGKVIYSSRCFTFMADFRRYNPHLLSNTLDNIIRDIVFCFIGIDIDKQTKSVKIKEQIPPF